MSVGILSILPIALYFYTKQIRYLQIFAAWIAVSWTTDLLKYASVKAFPEAKWARRPGGTYCSMISYEGSPYTNRPDNPGFPSGHLSTTVFLILLLFQQAKRDGLLRGSLLQQVLLVLYILAVAWSRYRKRCHTPFQILAGATLGIVMAYCFAVFF